MDKKALRAEIKAKKRAMTEAQIEETSRLLARQLFDHPAYRNAKSIFGYLSYNQEVRTLPILEQAQKDGKRVAVPKGDDNLIAFVDQCIEELQASGQLQIWYDEATQYAKTLGVQ